MISSQPTEALVLLVSKTQVMWILMDCSNSEVQFGVQVKNAGLYFLNKN